MTDQPNPIADDNSAQPAIPEPADQFEDDLDQLDPDEDELETDDLDVLDQHEPDQDDIAARDDLHDFPEIEITTPSVIEAVLFAADEPISPSKLTEIADAPGVTETREIVDQLNEKYQQMNCAFRIEAIAGGFQMLTLSPFNTWLRKLLKVRSESKLSPAALETLAIIAYKQPILRVDIEAIRGVACGEMVRQLCDKALVKIIGRAEVLGRPLLYGTTKRFLQVFGLNSLKDLPTAEDLKKPQ